MTCIFHLPSIDVLINLKSSSISSFNPCSCSRLFNSFGFFIESLKGIHFSIFSKEKITFSIAKKKHLSVLQHSELIYIYPACEFSFVPSPSALILTIKVSSSETSVRLCLIMVFCRRFQSDTLNLKRGNISDFETKSHKFPGVSAFVLKMLICLSPYFLQYPFSNNFRILHFIIFNYHIRIFR